MNIPYQKRKPIKMMIASIIAIMFLLCISAVYIMPNKDHISTGATRGAEQNPPPEDEDDGDTGSNDPVDDQPNNPSKNYGGSGGGSGGSENPSQPAADRTPPTIIHQPISIREEGSYEIKAQIRDDRTPTSEIRAYIEYTDPRSKAGNWQIIEMTYNAEFNDHRGSIPEDVIHAYYAMMRGGTTDCVEIMNYRIRAIDNAENEAIAQFTTQIIPYV